MDLTIRQAIAEDAEAARIGWQAFDEAFGGDRKITDDMRLYRDEYFSAEHIETDLSQADTIYFIAETETEMAGYAKIQIDFGAKIVWLAEKQSNFAGFTRSKN